MDTSMKLSVICKDYPGYSKYSVTRDGRVLRANGTEVKQWRNHRGYSLVTLWCSNTKKSWQVHRLVAMCYCINPSNKEQVNHIDGDKTNNSSDNLEWVTASENINHAHDTGLTTTRLCLGKQLDIRELVSYGFGRNQVAKILGLSWPTVDRYSK